MLAFRRNTLSLEYILAEKECLLFVSPTVVLPTCNFTDCIEVIFDHPIDRGGVESQPQCECFKSCCFSVGFSIAVKKFEIPKALFSLLSVAVNGHTKSAHSWREVLCAMLQITE